jgi:UTP-glucose-1-phosphate uridylyltransferase
MDDPRSPRPAGAGPFDGPASAASVTRAVIPASFEPRLLPAAKAVPPDLLPLAGVPAIERIVASAVAVGVTDVLLVADRTGRALEDHFDRDPVLEQRLTDVDAVQALVAVRRSGCAGTVHSVRSDHRPTVADAVALARTHVGDRPFLVLDPRRYLVDDGAVLAAMVAAHERTGACVVALPGRTDVARAHADELTASGRYLFTADAFAAIDAVRAGHPEAGAGQLLEHLARQRLLVGVAARQAAYDLGDPMERLALELELLLGDPRRGAGVAALLAALAKQRAWDAA